MSTQVGDWHLETKLLPPLPARSSWLVARERLVERLDQAVVTSHLTVVAAPAGYGKTTLLSTWWAGRNALAGRVAWLSLDHADRDPVRFWTNLLESLGRVDEHFVGHSLPLVRASPGVPVEAIVVTLVNDLARAAQAVCVVLDDFHLIANSATPGALETLVQRLPPNAHVLVASRVEPALGLARCRALGQLAEFGVDDLRFTDAEAGELLEHATGRALEAHSLARLMGRTEGWVTGLRLAGLSLVGRNDPHAFLADFSGSHRFVLDYLLDEVVSRQPSHVQAFLLDTSVLDRLTGPLCDALTDSAGGQEMLEWLERTGMFITALDARRRWYRYHHLFADALRARLEVIGADRVRMLHARARIWFEHAGHVDEAIQHAVASGEFEAGANLVERTADRLWMRSEVTTLLAWLDQFPAEFLATRPALGIYRAWALFFTNRIEAVEAELATVESRLSATSAPGSSRIATLVLAIRACVASVTGQHQTAIEYSRRALAHLEDEPVWRTVVLQSLGTGLRAAGEVDSAVEVFVQARTAAAEHGDLSGIIYSACNLGLLQQATGDLIAAQTTYRDALARANAVGGQELPITGMAVAGLANVVRERNELDAAMELALRAHELGVLGNYGDIIAEALLVRARICCARSVSAEARGLVDEATKVVERQHVTSRVASELCELRVRLLLEAGDRAAADVLTPLPSSEPPAFERYPEWRARARVERGNRQFGTAAETVQSLRLADERAGRSGSALKAQVLEVLCLVDDGRSSEALAGVGQALEFAAARGWVRVLADEGSAMAQLLAEFLNTADPVSSAVSLSYARRILSALAPDQTGTPLGITPRELEILRLISTGLSNVAIARQLVLTHATVKTHVNNVYRKLSVQNRVQALERARQLGLVP